MLTPKKRLSRREIKEDKLVTTYVETSKFVGENSKLLFGGLVAIVVLILAISLIRSGKRSAEAKASLELARGKTAYESGDYTATIDILRAVVEDYGGSKSGALATLFLANSMYEQGQYAEARVQYQRFAEKMDDEKFLASAATAGAAACLEQSGEYGGAASYYERAASDYSDQVYAPNYLLACGRCYVLAGDKAKASEVLRKLVEAYPNSQTKSQAEYYLGEIGG